MEEKNKLKKLIPIIILIFFLGLSFLLLDLRKDNDDKKEDTVIKEYKLLKDYSRFFTVNSCIIRYITFLENNDIDSILKVLNTDYKDTNNINENNIFSFVDSLDGNYSFKSNKIYYKNIKDYYIKYYVSGVLLEDNINGENIIENKYYVVTLDTKEQLFDIAPYNGEIFKEEV